MKVRIYQPARTAMQSGTGNTKSWILEFGPSRRDIEPLMGWTRSRDTRQQLKMRFPTREQAIAYAEKEGMAFEVIEPKTRKIHPKSYAENFL